MSATASLPIVLGLALLASGLLACSSPSEPAPTSPALEQVRIGAVDWYVDYDAAAAYARSVDKSLWVHFGENPG